MEIAIAADHNGARFAGDASRKQHMLIVLQHQYAVAARRNADKIGNLSFDVLLLSDNR